MNRQEIIFLYDIKDANPNGDPLDSNKPRIDEEKGINIVTDVRLKRTIRDYLYEYKGYDGSENKDIFVREIIDDEKNKYIKDGKKRAKDFNESEENVLSNCIDIRLFGGVIPLSKDSITFTGPVQFQMGRSLHKVEIKHIKGTGAFASGDKKKQNTFREEYILPYSLISFYGIVNENAGIKTKLTDKDVELLLESIWEGTKNLISRSKFGQVPRLLLKVNYKEKGFFIGELNNYIKIKSELLDTEIRDISELKIDITDLKNIFKKNNSKIESIDYIINDRLKFICNGKNLEIENILEGKMQEFNY